MYTIGIKRRFWPGYRLYKVTAHSWADFRFILTLADGGQLIIPGFSCPALKVYDDFWKHHHMLESQRRAPAAVAPPPQAREAARELIETSTPPPRAAPPPAPVERELPPIPRAASEEQQWPMIPTEAGALPPPHVHPEVMRRAAERVRGISEGTAEPGPLGARSLPQ